MTQPLSPEFFFQAAPHRDESQTHEGANVTLFLGQEFGGTWGVLARIRACFPERSFDALPPEQASIDGPETRSQHCESGSGSS
jgi:hypothetical protein